MSRSLLSALSQRLIFICIYDQADGYQHIYAARIDSSEKVLFLFSAANFGKIKGYSFKYFIPLRKC